MTATNLDAFDMSSVTVGGLIREDMMNKIWDLSPVELPLTQRIGSGSCVNPRFSWTIDKLATPVITGQQIDGADQTSTNNATVGTRVNNFTEERVKVVQISNRSEAVDSAGSIGTLAVQLMKRQQELRRDIEATILSNNASLADNGTSVAGRTGGLDSWLATNVSIGATGTAAGFSTSTGLTVAYGPGTKRAMSEAVFKDLLQSVYENGGEAMIVMARPPVVRKFSEFQFTSGARIATMQKDNRGATGPATALGAVNVYLSDWGSVEIISNRMQAAISAGVSTLFIIDPSLLELTFLQGYVTQPLAKTGLAEKRQIVVDVGLRVGNQAGLAAYRDIDETLAMTA